jgi:GTP cyclohydrolase I
LGGKRMSEPEKREIDRPRIEEAVREILAAIGEDPQREGVLGTPRRVADAYAYLFSGLGEDPVEHLDVGFAEGRGDPVMVKDIYLASICEHHLLPFIGKVHLAYVPQEKIVGLSKLARLVEGYARRPQLQERLTAQISDALFEPVGSRGSLVVIEAEHSCMTMRGVQKPGSITVTSAARGVFEEEPERRAETISLMLRRA